MGEIDALSDQALRLLASAGRATSPSQATSIRCRAMRLIALAERMERDGARIMTDQPSLRAALRYRD